MHSTRISLINEVTKLFEPIMAIQEVTWQDGICIYKFTLNVQMKDADENKPPHTIQGTYRINSLETIGKSSDQIAEGIARYIYKHIIDLYKKLPPSLDRLSLKQTIRWLEGKYPVIILSDRESVLADKAREVDPTNEAGYEAATIYQGEDLPKNEPYKAYDGEFPDNDPLTEEDKQKALDDLNSCVERWVFDSHYALLKESVTTIKRLLTQNKGETLPQLENVSYGTAYVRSAVITSDIDGGITSTAKDIPQDIVTLRERFEQHLCEESSGDLTLDERLMLDMFIDWFTISMEQAETHLSGGVNRNRWPTFNEMLNTVCNRLFPPPAAN